MSLGAVRLKGLRELNRAFEQIDAGVKKEMQRELHEAAEPVRSAAESKAVSAIRNIGNWSGMRVGVTRSAVYVAPKRRRRGGSPRPNLAPVLMNRAMQPALDENKDKVVARLERWLDGLGDRQGF